MGCSCRMLHSHCGAIHGPNSVQTSSNTATNAMMAT
jgi:hypothetical protein